MDTRRWLLWALAAFAAFAFVPASQAEPGASKTPFALALRALTDAGATELALTVTPTSADLSAPTDLKHVQIRTFAGDRSVQDVANLNDVAMTDGRRSISLPPLSRGQRIDVQVQLQDEQTVRTIVLDEGTQVLLRPDLRVANVQAPSSILSGRSFTVSAEVSELNGDVALDATAELTRVDTGESLGSVPLHVPAGESVPVSFPVTLAGSGPVDLRLAVVQPSVDEVTSDNNVGSATVEVTQFQLDAGTTLLQWLAGFGGQFNHSLFYKPLNPIVPPGAPALTAKVDTLEPQLARIFFPATAFTTQPDRLDAFEQVVHMAQDAGAIINVTWQSGFTNIDTNMSKFAGVLADLVKNQGITNLRWVTLLNEPNSITNAAFSMATYELMYRTLDADLRAAGVRDQIRFMGGDLLQNNQRIWFQYMAAHMNDLLDAYSVHIFWSYWEPTDKLEARLDDVNTIVTSELPAEARKPVYATEYGVRGLLNFGGASVSQPGVWADGTPMAQTTISAFQLGWFDVYSSRLGYPGTMVWDLFNAKYDGGTQDFSCIGPAPDFALRPCYSVLRLFTATTEPGWRVVGVDGEAGRKLLTAYAGDGDLLTVVGLDRGGGQLNDGSGAPISYSVGGLPPLETFTLVVWNRGGGAGLTSDETVTTDAAGVAWLTIPQHAIWALTTHPIDG